MREPYFGDQPSCSLNPGFEARLELELTLDRKRRRAVATNTAIEKHLPHGYGSWPVEARLAAQFFAEKRAVRHGDMLPPCARCGDTFLSDDGGEWTESGQWAHLDCPVA